MIAISEKTSCCGCGACAQTCPRGCITMKPDAEGFLYPTVQLSACVHCNACNQVCPMELKMPQSASNVPAFAAYATDSDIRQSSSSGGIFSLIAQRILEQGGVIFGAAFDEDFSVRHQMVASTESLNALRGSKYVQSRTEDTFRNAEILLKSGKMVLFTGVACQIAGLKAFLHRDYPNLYTMDVLCHGVPSPAIWKAYLSDQCRIHGSSVKSVSFREKSTGWKQFSMKISFENGKTYCQSHDEDAFMRLFLENICLRPACHSCRFKAFPRASDLTLGDAWGIDDVLPEMDDDFGTSVVLINSEKGQWMLDQVEACMVCKPESMDRLLPETADSRRPVSPHPRRSLLFRAAKRGATVKKMLSVLKGNPVRRLLGAGMRLIQQHTNRTL